MEQFEQEETKKQNLINFINNTNDFEDNFNEICEKLKQIIRKHLFFY